MTAHLVALLGATVLLVAAVATGGLVLRALGATPSVGERPLFALVLGIGVQGTLLLCCAAAGVLHPAVLWLVPLVPALVGWRELGACAAFARRAQARLRELSALERVTLLLVAGIVTVTLFVGAVAPVLDWDSLMYHLRLPQQFLERGRIFLPPEGVHLAFLGLFQFLYLPLLAIGAESGPGLLNAAFVGVLGLSLAVVGTRLFGLRTGAMAAIALWGSSAILIVGVTPRIDVSILVVLLLAQYAAMRSADADAEWALPVAAVLGGIAIAMKYHAIAYLVGVAPFVLWALRRRPQPPAARVRRLSVALALFALTLLPWFLKNIAFFGAPLFPYFAERQVAPFIAGITGSTAIPAELPAGALNALGASREAISLAALVFRPAQLTVELEGGDFTRNPLFYLAPLALLWWRDRRLWMLAVPALGYLGVALGYFAHTNLRYLLPAIPAMLLVVAATMQRLAARSARRGVEVAMVVLAALAAWPGLQLAASRLLTPVRVQIAAGTLAPTALLNRDLAYVGAKEMEARTPPDARILMLFEARGYYYTREVIQDNLVQFWPLLVSIGATDNCLAGTGITHLVVNSGAVEYYIRRGLDPRRVLWDRFPEFERRCLETIASAPGVSFYRLR